MHYLTDSPKQNASGDSQMVDCMKMKSVDKTAYTDILVFTRVKTFQYISPSS